MNRKQLLEFIRREICPKLHIKQELAHIFMLGGLSDAGQRHAVEAAAEEVAEGESEATLQGCRRAHAGTQRHVAAIDGIETFYYYAGGLLNVRDQI